MLQQQQQHSPRNNDSKAEHTCQLGQAELVAGPVELVIQQQQPAPRRNEAQPTHTNLWGQGGGGGGQKGGRRENGFAIGHAALR